MSVNKWELETETELGKRVGELSALSRDHNKLQAVIRRLVEMGRQSYEASSEFRVDLYGNLARALLRELGQVAEDVVMFVGPDALEKGC